jgi:hypothetical protein
LGRDATLVHRGHLLNRPYSSVDQPAPESRPAIAFGCEDAINLDGGGSGRNRVKAGAHRMSIVS